jgi:hypothetical protein
MTEMVPRLDSICARLADLAQELSGAGQDGAAERIRALAKELEAVIRDAGLPPPVPRRRQARLRGDVKKCPRCTIRSLHSVPGDTRPAADGSGAEEGLWLCSSCGYEVWLPED